MIKTVPNILTIMRLLLVPVIVYFISLEQMMSAFAVFLIAGVSDGVDGFIARQFHAKTRLGAILDPVADKVMLVSIFVALGMIEALPRWLIVLFVSRDLGIIGAVLLSSALGQRLKIKPILSSKLNTALQIMLASLILAVMGLGVAEQTVWHIVIEVLIWSSAATTVISWLGYLFIWLTYAAEDGATEPHEAPIARPAPDSVLDEDYGASMIDLVRERQADLAEDIATVRERSSAQVAQVRELARDRARESRERLAKHMPRQAHKDDEGEEGK